MIGAVQQYQALRLHSPTARALSWHYRPLSQHHIFSSMLPCLVGTQRFPPFLCLPGSSPSDDWGTVWLLVPGLQTSSILTPLHAKMLTFRLTECNQAPVILAVSATLATKWFLEKTISPSACPMGTPSPSCHSSVCNGAFFGQPL